MFHSAEQEKRIYAEQELMRPGEGADLSLCQYGALSCVRCCLPHIGGDSHVGLPHLNPNQYLGPCGIVMKFKNFNPLKDPRIEASQYEDSFPDVGKREMERRFSQRRSLFLRIYDPKKARQSLLQYMEEAQKEEGYTYRHQENTGLASLYIGGSFSTKHLQKGDLPECHLLGFIDARGRVGCLAHPLSETSHGHDGRDQVGFFNHTGCCRNVGCEASKEFRYLSKSGLKVFDKAVDGMSWYQYSRHAVSVLVYYLRAYDFVVQRLDERGMLDGLTLKDLAALTNILFDEWPLRKPESPAAPEPTAEHMTRLAILSTDIPLAEKILYIALDSRFSPDLFAAQLMQARDCIAKRTEALHAER